MTRTVSPRATSARASETADEAGAAGDEIGRHVSGPPAGGGRLLALYVALRRRSREISLRQRRIVHFGRDHRRKWPRRVGPRVAILLRGRRRERSDREPRRDQESRDDPEETSFCRHGHTLSYLQPSANFCRDDVKFPEAMYRWLTVSEDRPNPRRSRRRFAAAAARAPRRPPHAACPASPTRQPPRGTRRATTPALPSRRRAHRLDGLRPCRREHRAAANRFTPRHQRPPRCRRHTRRPPIACRSESANAPLAVISSRRTSPSIGDRWRRSHRRQRQLVQRHASQHDAGARATHHLSAVAYVMRRRSLLA